MATITISRQLGSCGEAVAQAIAQQLGYRVIYRELLNQAAQRAGTPEMALAALDVLDLFQMRPSLQAQDRFQQALRDLIIELADVGKVIIIGRAGCVLLRTRPDVFHVRLVAPVEQRVARIAQEHAISYTAAQAQVEASDRVRNTYLQHYYHTDWDNPQLYDLVLNMAKFTVDAAAELVCLACKSSLTSPNLTSEMKS